LAAAYLMTSKAVHKLFDTIGPRFGDRNGGYLRIVRVGWQKGDGAEKAFIELLGSEKVQEEKKQKRTEARAKRAAETKKAMEEAEAQAKAEGGGETTGGEDKEKEKVRRKLAPPRVITLSSKIPTHSPVECVSFWAMSAFFLACRIDFSGH